MKKLVFKKKEKALAKQGDDTKKTEREKVNERREEVLAKGRKFKYPLQYSKHKLVFNTIIIAVVAIVLISVSGWFALYKMQSSADVLYRITGILPLPVAKVDEKDVRFSDYLMIFRSSIKPAGQDVDTDELSKEYYKRVALNDAEEYTYALKLAEELGIEVTDEEVTELFNKHRKTDGIERSEESFLKVLQDNFGLSKSEYERMLYLSLVKMKVEEEIDEHAKELAKKIEKMLAENGGDLTEVAEALGGEVFYEDTGGMTDSRRIDGGKTSMALSLEKGKISKAFVSSNGDGYCFVKLIDKNEEASQVNYASIQIPFREFSKKMEKIREENKIVEYISIKEDGEAKQ